MYINRAINREYVKDSSIDVTTPGLRRYYTEIQKEILNEPLILCDNFIKIAESWDLVKDYPLVKLLLKCNDNAKLYLASYLYRYEIKDINCEVVNKICECLLRLFIILELMDTGYSSSKFKTFLFSENINLVNPKVTIENIIENFNIHINKSWDKEGLVEAINEYEKNILVFVNEYLYAKYSNLDFNFSENVNIEHIMPASGNNIEIIRQDAGISDKDEFKALVNKLGNKILLEERINKSIGNEWFKSKKQNTIEQKTGYKNSAYPIAKNLVTYPTDLWTREDINKATGKVINRIINFIFQ